MILCWQKIDVHKLIYKISDMHYPRRLQILMALKLCYLKVPRAGSYIHTYIHTESLPEYLCQLFAQRNQSDSLIKRHCPSTNLLSSG